MPLFNKGGGILTIGLIVLLLVFFVWFIFPFIQKSLRNLSKSSDESGRYFTQNRFVQEFGDEMESAVEVYSVFEERGVSEGVLTTFDFTFLSDTKEKLDSLGNFLTENYGFKMDPSKKVSGHWEITGDSKPIPLDSENLLYWALDLYVKGFEFDCKLEAYGALMDDGHPTFLDMSPTMEDQYFEAGLAAYDKRDLGSAIIHWSLAIKINPENADAYYSRAIARNELHTWKAALADYDKAIELSPEFVDALVNRGALRDEHGDYQGAIDDYNKAIETEPDHHTAYFNRGNTRLNMGDRAAACMDWKKAKELGADYADERIDSNCK